MEWKLHPMISQFSILISETVKLHFVKIPAKELPENHRKPAKNPLIKTWKPLHAVEREKYYN